MIKTKDQLGIEFKLKFKEIPFQASVDILTQFKKLAA
jgi:hypothetical protein